MTDKQKTADDCAEQIEKSCVNYDERFDRLMAAEIIQAAMSEAYAQGQRDMKLQCEIVAGSEWNECKPRTKVEKSVEGIWDAIRALPIIERVEGGE